MEFVYQNETTKLSLRLLSPQVNWPRRFRLRPQSQSPLHWPLPSGQTYQEGTTEKSRTLKTIRINGDYDVPGPPKHRQALRSLRLQILLRVDPGTMRRRRTIQENRHQTADRIKLC